MGQHFLVDNEVLDSIISAAELNPEDVVLEVGPGSGAHTQRLVHAVGRVIAIEKAAKLAASLSRRLGDPRNLTSVQADARTCDFGSLLGRDVPYKVVANLPYYAANPIVRRFLECEPMPTLMVVMVQREVARNMPASPGEMPLLSVAVQYYSDATLICDVPPSAFSPPPKVYSAVVRLDMKAEATVHVFHQRDFFDLVRAGFAAPRKQLRNSLAKGLDVTGQVTQVFLDGAGIDARRRPETLSIDEWARVYTAVEHHSRGRAGEIPAEISVDGLSEIL